ncbi:MAG: carboxymuconolactone decarboxylase family protein, partial [Mesorhizobium sp.]
MKQRLQFFGAAPEIMKAVSALNKAVDECGLEEGLLHLI